MVTGYRPCVGGGELLLGWYPLAYCVMWGATHVAEDAMWRIVTCGSGLHVCCGARRCQPLAVAVVAGWGRPLSALSPQPSALSPQPSAADAAAGITSPTTRLSYR